MRSRFDEQLETLNREIITMAALCEKAIASASIALMAGDLNAAAEITQMDMEIRQMERDIEARCMKLLLQQQPVAKDLHQISAAMKMVTDLERIGNQAADIAEIVGFLNGRGGADCANIAQMAQAAIRMVNKSIDAFVRKDVVLAEEVILADDVVDNYFLDVKRTLIGLIASKPEDGEYALDLLMIAKYFERIGDHATNIAEWVEFAATGLFKQTQ